MHSVLATGRLVTISAKPGLTKRQQQILTFIEQTADSQGYPPTRAEICKEFGFRSPNAAEDHLKALERKGAIELKSGVSRGIHLPQRSLPASTRLLPLVGRVAAGLPILAVENIDQRYAVDVSLFKPKPDYLLKVHGMSMRDAGILDGDLVAIHRTPEARSRQIVVARVDDEVTVKRLQRNGRRVSLLPENDEFEPISIDPRKVELVIEGIVVGNIRNRIGTTPPSKP